MKFLCGSCRTKYQISDEKVRGKILTIRCKKCGAKILVRESLSRQGSDMAIAPVVDGAQRAEPTQAGSSVSLERVPSSEPQDSDDLPTSIAPIPSDIGLAGFEWFVAIDGQQHGPYAFAELVGKVKNHEIAGRHYVWHDGMSDWTRVRSMPDLAPYLAFQSSPQMSPPPPPDPSGVDDSPPGKVLDFAAAKDGPSRSIDLPIPTFDAPPKSESGVQAAVSDDIEHSEPEPPEEASPDPVSSSAEPSSEAASLGTITSVQVPRTDSGSEDIFANVPRATPKEVFGREPTRFWVSAAGVNNVEKKNRIGRIAGLSLITAVLVFVGLWASGVIRIALPGIGDPFNGPSETTAVVHSTTGVEDPGNYALLVDGVRIEPAEKRRRRRKRSAQGALDNLGSQKYIKDDPDSQSSLSSLSGVKAESSISLSGPGSKIDAPDRLTDFDGPQANLDIPPPDVDSLDAATIEKVVAGKKASVRLCYERSLKAREKLQGKLQLLLVVQPSGKVSRTQILSSAFKGSVVGQCIQSSIKNWRFPRFGGKAQEIELPFVFQRGG